MEFGLSYLTCPFLSCLLAKGSSIIIFGTSFRIQLDRLGIRVEKNALLIARIILLKGITIGTVMSWDIILFTPLSTLANSGRYKNGHTTLLIVSTL